MENKEVPTVDTKTLIGQTYTTYEVDLTSKDLILYALSLGFNADHLKKDEYKFTYELSPDFTSFPTIPVVIAHRDFTAFTSTQGLPKFNPIMVLHGSEEVNIIKTI